MVFVISEIVLAGGIRDRFACIQSSDAHDDIMRGCISFEVASTAHPGSSTRLCLEVELEFGVRAVNGKLSAAGAMSTSGSTSCHSPFHFAESPNSWMRL